MYAKLCFQSSSALNNLLVLSRDDCTLPQLNLSNLKTAKIGQKRKCELKKEVSEAEDNIYRINYEQASSRKLKVCLYLRSVQVQASKLNSKIVSKNPPRKGRARLALIHEERAATAARNGGTCRCLLQRAQII